MSTDHRAAGPDYEAVRRYVETNLEQAKRRRRRALWRLHFLIYFVVNLTIWAVVFSTGAAAQPAAPTLTGLVTMFWGIGLLLHARMLYLESPAGVRQLQARLAMEAMRSETVGELPKLKREQIMRLSDDGELVSDEPLDVEVKYHAQSES